MYKECRHIKPNGSRCHSPALSGKPYCYHHNNFHRRGNATSVGVASFPTTSIEDLHGIQIALNQVLSSFNSPYVDARRAGVFLYGLNLATNVAKHISDPPATESVRTLQNEPGSESEADALAPEKIACEPPKDCLTCAHCDYCANYQDADEEETEEEYEAAEES